PYCKVLNEGPKKLIFFSLPFPQAVSINKAINTQEVAVKEKHARNILLFKGAHTFWLAVNRLPLSSNAVLCWKFCHVFHKLLRDGHPNVIKDSMRHKADLNDMSRMWGHLSEGYGKLCSIYLKLLITKMEFHIKNPRFPGNLQMSNRQLDEAGENDVNNFFQLTVEMFDYLDCELNLFLGVFSSLDMSRSVSVTAAGQCRLAPLIQVILDSSHLYDYTVKLLFKLHSCELKSLFYRSSNLQYFKRLIQIPQLPEVRLLHTKQIPIFGFSQSGRLCQALRGRVNELEAELAEQTHLKQQALGESEFLRVELDDLRRVKEDTEKEQRSLSEIERKAQANEQRYTKLKEKYTELVQSHADLLRKNAEVTRQMTVARAAQDEVENVKKEMQDRLKAAQDATSQQVGHKPHACAHTRTHTPSSREQSLESELVSLRWAALRAALEEAGRIVQDCLNQLEDPAHISCTSSADYLVSRCQVALDCVERLQSARDGFVSDNTGELHFAHLVGDVIMQGSATSHMVPVEQADGEHKTMYHPGIPCVFILHNAEIDVVCYFVFSEQKLRPRGLELQQGELGDLVEQEMSATSAAVESAAARIEEMLNKSRAVDTGIKMEVNERILASCTDLMQAIKVLVLSSKDLQRDIVESGRGAASMKEFYAKNSRWTEGLISASKAVGWGATMLVDAADQVVQGTGKFEELMVCSHEIAASTAQLVAASKVKADKDSPNLSRLRQASKGVTQATAGVVASTKSGKSQIEDTETMDFSAMTLTQIKRQEMDAQVLVLELETRLQKERERLGELRKKHYELAGVNGSGWDTT
uniref:Huntingtin-interacting protein 1-related protein n=1 Tax=Cyprinus carpio TaxID=7962 RepID=A0A8C1M3H0_CYPCA